MISENSFFHSSFQTISFSCLVFRHLSAPVCFLNKGGEVSDLSIEQAAVIAAYYSKARESTLVPVDYTKVRNLKKPVGAKPGKVIYHVYYTIIVNPDEKLVESLKVK